MTDDPPETQAAELALGVLDSDERAAANRRLLAEPMFAAEVAWWRDRLAGLFDAVPAAEPPPALFDRIERGVDGLRAPVTGRRRWLWPSLAGASGVAAAALLAALLLRPTPAPVIVTRPAAPAVLLAAALTPTDGGQPMSAVYDARARTLRLPAALMADARHSAELWVIGPDGKPYSLGLLRPRDPTAVPVTEANRPRLLANAVLAISLEPLGGSPTGQPTGPVVVKGPLQLS